MPNPGLLICFFKFYTYNQMWILGEENEAVASGPSFSEMM